MVDGTPIACHAVSNGAGREQESLVERFARGDADAFDQIVTLHQPRIAGLVYRLLAWPQDVDDVVQEVFLSAWKSRKKFRGQSSLATWLTAITVNKCRSHRRRWWFRLKRMGDRQAEPSESTVRGADQAAMDRERFMRVRRAMRLLPHRHREVVVLRYLQEMSVDRIGEVLGISVGAVQVRLTRARSRLHEMLGSLSEV